MLCNCEEAAMGKLFVDGVIGVLGLFSVITGFVALVRPLVLAETLGLSLNGASGMNEMRAQYGGFFLMAGLLAIAAVGGLIPRPWALALMVVVFGGLIFGRLISLVIDGGFKQYRGAIPALFVIDFCGFSVSLIALASEMAWL